MKVAVIGAGRQGPAAAYDLAVHGDYGRIVLADYDKDVAKDAAARINAVLDRKAVVAAEADASDHEGMKEFLYGFDLAVAAAPYRLNPVVAHAGIDVSCSVVDMGVDTDDALLIHERDDEARAKNVRIVTDCGIAPGTVNVMASALLGRSPASDTVRLYCGGLPESATAPFWHKVGFSVDSLLGEYVDDVDSLRGGEIVRSHPLEDVELLEFPGFGRLEAATTSGGTGTAPYRLRGRLREYEYKTLRYPGHWEAMRFMRDAGLWSEETLSDGSVPRRVSLAVMERHMVDPVARDVVVTRVVAYGPDGARTGLDLVDRADPVTGFSAMQRTTGFSTAVVAHDVLSGRVGPGCRACEEAVDAEDYLKALSVRGVTTVPTAFS
ncbi:MAG: saccharopine dehydrogenase NADP-binding domain-containing protein [Armatimonadetes bacterium]|nr:saccharopine dehydrogenase NADP-binding domain-containing protein [Armatimonadota bacterium]